MRGNSESAVRQLEREKISMKKQTTTRLNVKPTTSAPAKSKPRASTKAKAAVRSGLDKELALLRQRIAELEARPTEMLLAQREAELAIINSVQAGLASKLDMQSIYDLVGDKIHAVFFDAQVVDILTYDPATELLNPQYVIERGIRYDVKPWPVRGFRMHVISTGQPLLINKDVAL